MYFEETEAVDDAIRILRVKTKTLPFYLFTGNQEPFILRRMLSSPTPLEIVSVRVIFENMYA